MTGSDSRVPTTDLLLSPFGAHGPDMVEAARQAERAGYGGLWAEDHFSGAMVGRQWSREPFTVLGAIAVATATIRFGPLVANVVNRHPALLASAAATLQSLGRGRVVLGLGAGAGPGSYYAGEFDAIGVELGDLASRRRRLVETIEVVKQIWNGGGDYAGEFFTLNGLDAVVGSDVPLPPLVVGASSAGTVELAATHADGVNVVGGPGWERLVELARDLTAGRRFEISVFMALDPDHPTGGELDSMVDLGVDSRVLSVVAPYPVDRLHQIADRLRSL